MDKKNKKSPIEKEKCIEEDILHKIELNKFEKFYNDRAIHIKDHGLAEIQDTSNLYVYENLIFKITNNKARFVFLDVEEDFDGYIAVPEKVHIKGRSYYVTSIGEGAFMGYVNLKKISLPSTITEIDARAFSGCKKLELDNLPEKLSKIGYSAFSRCENLQIKQLPENLTEIGDLAFYDCKKISIDKIPNNVFKIGLSAFENTSIKKIFIPESVREIGNNAFATSLIEKITLAGESSLSKIDILNACGGRSVDITIVEKA